MAITKVRQQEILQYKIDTLQQKLNSFITYGISINKYIKLDTRRDNFIAAKVILDAS